MVDRNLVRSEAKEQREKRKVHKPEGQRCQSRPREFGNRADIKAVVNCPGEITD